MHSSTLPLRDKSAGNVSTVVKGIGLSLVLAPLHHVHMHSKLVTGFILVAVSTAFPVDDDDFIMANRYLKL